MTTIIATASIRVNENCDADGDILSVTHDGKSWSFDAAGVPEFFADEYDALAAYLEFYLELSDDDSDHVNPAYVRCNYEIDYTYPA